MPPHIEIRFVTSNAHKLAEAQEILGKHNVKVIESPLKIEELQTTNTKMLVHDKLLKAFKRVGRPLFVEHTGLYLDHLGGLPGGLTQIFWDTIQAERFAELYGKLAPNRKAIARTAISFCDGRKIHDFQGEVAGQIVEAPRGPRDFQWDCVFQPNGEKMTFAEMGDRKNEISMRRAALDEFATHLGKDLLP
jgi:XTP/dITP diphosphohydrolase